jgi:glycosyltransferase involved in cell wall biosynthesis
VTAVLPALNEGRTIGAVVRSLPRTVAGEVIVVDGGSADDTVAQATEAGASVIVERRRGYGRACLSGAGAATGEVIVFLDADGADDPAQIHLLVEPIANGRADLVLGSRVRGIREPGSLAPLQLVGNRLVTMVLNRRCGLAVTDIGPFRAIRADVLRSLGLREMTYGWPTEMIRNTARQGHTVLEVPVDYRRRQAGRSKVSGNAKASVLAGWHMLRVAFG